MSDATIARGKNLFLESDIKGNPQLTEQMDLCLVSQIFDEYVAHVLKICDEESLRSLWREGHFRFSNHTDWLTPKSSREALFKIWGGQLAAGANSFVL